MPPAAESHHAWKVVALGKVVEEMAAGKAVAMVAAATEVAMVAVVTAEEVMARMQESKRGSLLG